MVVHHPLSDLRLVFQHIRANLHDDAAGLMAGDGWLRTALYTAGLGLAAAGSPVLVQIATTHTRRLDLQDHLTRAWFRIRKLHDLQLTIARKYDTAHDLSLFVFTPMP